MPAALLLAFFVQDPGFARAEALLLAGRPNEAVAVAATLVRRAPRDPRARLLLGRAHYARPVIGRYPALAAFRAAARLGPADPEPLYWQMRVGFRLGSDEGDRIARAAILGILALDPGYRDVWSRLGELYGGPDIWRHADAALGRHPADPAALRHRAELAIALLEPARADSLLRLAAQGRSPEARAYLLRAEANFLQERDTAGYAWFDSALSLADRDSAQALWDQAWVIASPAEAADYAATPAAEWPAFFRAFWSRRDPNLLTRANERIAEHYRRRAEARRMYRLLHPQRMIYRSAVARARATEDAREALAALARADPAALPGGSSTPPAASSRAGLLALPARALQDSVLPLAFQAGVGAAGLIFLRHGAPDVQLPCTPDPLRPLPTPGCLSALDGEGWLYRTPDGPLTVSLSHGGEYFFPVSREQLASTRTLLGTDRSAIPAPLAAQAWTAFYRSETPDRTAVYARAAPGTAAIAAWDNGGGEADRATGEGVLRLTLAPGDYRLGLDVDSAGVLGRHRGRLAVPDFAAPVVAISSLALAALDTLADRETMLGLMPADLTYAAGAPLAVYAEVYGLTATAGHTRYRVRYTFTPERGVLGRLFGAQPTVFEFDREVPAAAVVAEQLVIASGRLRPGRYRVTLAVTDLRRNVKSEAVTLVVAIR